MFRIFIYVILLPKGGDASKVKVYGPAVEAPVKAFTITYLIIDCKESGPGTNLLCDI